MQAQIRSDYMNVLSVETAGNETILVVACVDFEAYKRLPVALELGGSIHALTGWNSDRGAAYYKNNKLIARVVF